MDMLTRQTRIRDFYFADFIVHLVILVTLIFTITMSTITELKLLTLLNVSATKRPRDLDQPGGFKGSPACSRSPSTQPSFARQSRESAVKKRKSVVWGGELGPSGSTFGTKTNQGKAPEREISPESEGVVLEHDEYEADDSDEGEDEVTSGKFFCMSDLNADDNFIVHFGPGSQVLRAESMQAVSDHMWEVSRIGLSGYGKAVQLLPRGAAIKAHKNRASLH